MNLTPEMKELLYAAYTAGYCRFSHEFCGWETESTSPEAPLGFDEWLEENSRTLQ